MFYCKIIISKKIWFAISVKQLIFKIFLLRIDMQKFDTPDKNHETDKGNLMELKDFPLFTPNNIVKPQVTEA